MSGKIQYNKLWGLKKLRIIAKQLEGIAYVTPFKVYDSPSQVRASHYGNAERLLIRTDDRGRRYHHRDWAVMPRESLLGNPSYTFPVERVKGKMDEMSTRLNEIAWNGERKTRFIIHPTRKFDRINDASHTDGHIIVRGNMIMIKYNGFWYEYHFREKFSPLLDKQSDGRKKPMTRQVLKNIQRLIDVAVLSKQISLRKDRKYVLRFLTWNDNPSLLELYDLQEFRQLPYPKKKLTKN
ncbi:MAG: hypothetical protein AABW68_01965 [archaeon]